MYEAPFAPPRPSAVKSPGFGAVLPRRVSSPPPPLPVPVKVAVGRAPESVEELSSSVLLDAVLQPPTPRLRTPSLPSVEELSSSVLLDAVLAPVKPVAIPERPLEELSGSVLLDEVETTAQAAQHEAAGVASAPAPAEELVALVAADRHDAHDADAAPEPRELAAHVSAVAQTDAEAPPPALSEVPPASASSSPLEASRHPSSSPIRGVPKPPESNRAIEPPVAPTSEGLRAVPTAKASSPHLDTRSAPSSAAFRSAPQAIVSTTEREQPREPSIVAPPDSEAGEMDPFQALGDALSAPSTDDVSALAAPSVASLVVAPAAIELSAQDPAPAVASPSERASASPSVRPPVLAEEARHSSLSQPPLAEVSNDSRARILSPWAVRFATRPRWLSRGTLAAGGAVAGALVLLGTLVVMRASSTSGRSEGTVANIEPPNASPPPPPVAAAAPEAPIQAAPTPPPAAVVELPTACTAHGSARPLAPKAFLGADVTVVPSDAGFAIGFAVSASEGRALLVSHDEGATKSNSVVHSNKAIRHVTPVLAGKAMTATVDTETSKAKTLVSALSAKESPLDVSVHDGRIVVASRGAKNASALWLSPGGEAFDVPHFALVPSEPSRFVLTFRVGSSVYAGVVEHTGETFVPRGDLAKFDGQSGQVGAPVVAVSGDTAVVMWADRASPEAPWGLRYSRFRVGEAPGAAQLLPIPPGGHGEQAMAPGIAALPGGRFLLAWTDGMKPEHQVRAQTYQADMSPVGGPLLLSIEGVNAGQAAVGVAPNGDGVVAFLAANDSGYALDGITLSCGLH